MSKYGIIPYIGITNELYVKFSLSFLAAGSDYNATTETLVFTINITWIYVHIWLRDDIYLEFEEFFHGVITTSDPAVILDPDEATVVIQDDDSTLISVTSLVISFYKYSCVFVLILLEI